MAGKKRKGTSLLDEAHAHQEARDGHTHGEIAVVKNLQQEALVGSVDHLFQTTRHSVAHLVSRPLDEPEQPPEAPSNPSSPPVGAPSEQAKMKKPSISENNKTEITIAGMMKKSLPVDPGTKSSGAKAAMVVRTAKVTGTDISLAASMAAD